MVASELRLFHDAFFVGFEMGGATGDQAKDPGQYLNYRWRFVQQPRGDHAINDFHFSPDYHVDEILFRHIMGTVTNAIYFKPQAAYWFDLGRTRAIGINGGAIFSMAQVPVSTPGDALFYGIETDVSAGYRNTAEGFYAGITWGVFWPLAALNRPFEHLERQRRRQRQLRPDPPHQHGREVLGAAPRRLARRLASLRSLLHAPRPRSPRGARFASRRSLRLAALASPRRFTRRAARLAASLASRRSLRLADSLAARRGALVDGQLRYVRREGRASIRLCGPHVAFCGA